MPSNKHELVLDFITKRNIIKTVIIPVFTRKELI